MALMLDSAARGALTMGVTGLLPAGKAITAEGVFPVAKALLTQAVGRAVPDGASMALANSLYDTAVHGKPFSIQSTVDAAGGNIGAFALQNALMAVVHRAASPGAAGHADATSQMTSLDAQPDSAGKRDAVTAANNQANAALNQMVLAKPEATQGVMRGLVDPKNLAFASRLTQPDPGRPDDPRSAVLARVGQIAMEQGAVSRAQVEQARQVIAQSGVAPENQEAALQHSIGASVTGDTLLSVLGGKATERSQPEYAGAGKVNAGYLATLAQAGVAHIEPDGTSKLNLNYAFLLPKDMRERVATGKGPGLINVPADSDASVRDLSDAIREGHTGVTGHEDRPQIAQPVNGIPKVPADGQEAAPAVETPEAKPKGPVSDGGQAGEDDDHIPGIEGKPDNVPQGPETSGGKETASGGGSAAESAATPEAPPESQKSPEPSAGQEGPSAVAGQETSPEVAPAAAPEQAGNVVSDENSRAVAEVEKQWSGNGQGAQGEKSGRSATSPAQGHSQVQLGNELPAPENMTSRGEGKGWKAPKVLSKGYVEQVRDQVLRRLKLSNAPGVDVIQGYGDLPGEKGAQAEKERVKGFYDPNTGRVTLIADALKNVPDAVKVIVHELTHAGLDKVLTPEAYAKAMELVTESNRAAVEAVAAKRGLDMAKPEDALLAAKEFMAITAENQGKWDKVVAFVKDAIQKMFPGVKFSDDEVRQLLKRSGDYLRGKDGSGSAEPGGQVSPEEAIKRVAELTGKTPDQVREDYGYKEPGDYVKLLQHLEGGPEHELPSPGQARTVSDLLRAAGVSSMDEFDRLSPDERAKAREEAGRQVLQETRLGADKKPVADFWKAVASHDDAFRYKTTPSKDINEVARVMSNGRVTVQRIGDDVVLKNQAGGFIEILNTARGFVIHSPSADSQGRKEGGGALMYQIALAWAHNNGEKIRESGNLSNINAFVRRTSNMLSAALRFGTTAHMEPDAAQGVAGWRDGAHDSNIAALAMRESEQVMRAFPQLRDLTFDFKDGKFKDASGTAIDSEGTN